MARAKTGTWVRLVMGLLVGTAGSALDLAAAPEGQVGPSAVGGAADVTPMAPPAGRSSSRSHTALNNAIESERRGDYDAAAGFLREAQLHRSDLNPAEQQELDRRLRDVAGALNTRREGAARLTQAEQLLQQGRAAEAAEIVRRLAGSEPYLALPDRQRLADLRPRLQGSPVIPAAAVADPVAMVRTKVAQARALLAQQNFEAAEALARQAQLMGATLPAGEDTPQKVLESLDQARKDPRVLLQAARGALQQGDLSRAGHYLELAEKMSTGLSFPFWGDTPAKVRKDLQAAQARSSPTASPAPTGNAQAMQPPAPPAPPAAPAAAPQTDTAPKARLLVGQGRQALLQGNIALARRCAEESDALRANLGVNEDNPARLMADVRRREGGPASPQPAAAPHEHAVALLKQAREQLQAGRLDEAMRLGLQAQALHSDQWRLFDDTPDTFLKDVEKARQQQDRKESERVLAEARRHFEQKDYEGAKKLAFQASKLHGQYSITDLGDRPDKLLTEIQKAEDRLKKTTLPPAPLVAKNKDAGKPSPEKPVQPNSGAPDRDIAPRYTVRAQQLLAEARAAAGQGDFNRARQLVSQAQAMPVTFNRPGQDSPAMALRDIEEMARAKAKAPAPQEPLAAKPLPPRPSVPAGDTQLVSYSTIKRDEDRLLGAGTPSSSAPSPHAQAQKLLAEVRQLQRQHRLLEARQKLEEVQKLGAVFGPGEEGPGVVYQQLALQARQEIEALVHQANDTIRFGTETPNVRYQKAEQELAQADQLAHGFGLDRGGVEHTRRWLNELRAGLAQGGGRQDSLPPSRTDDAQPRPGQTEQGLALLEKIRLELRSGSTGIARRLAEQAATGPYGVREEALALLRNIDVEEMNQRALAARKAFDAAYKAYIRHEYQQAAAMLAVIDPRQLDDVQRNKMGELLMTPEMQPSARNRLVRGGQEAQESGSPPGSPRPAPASSSSLPAEAGHAHASDSPAMDPLLRTQQLREVAMQKARLECNRVLAEATRKFRVGETDEAIEQLQEYLTELDSEMSLAPGQMTLLTRPLKTRLEQFRLMKAREDFRNQNQAEMTAGKTRHDQKVTAEKMKEKNVAEMMRQFKDLYDQHKYAEAEGWAMRASEIDPDNPAVTAAVYMSRLARSKNRADEIKESRRKLFLDALNNVDDQGEAADAVETGITLTKDKDALARQKMREKHQGDVIEITPRRSDKERDIERQLTKSVRLNFKDVPLRNVLDDLRAFENLNIFVDEAALGEEGISLDRPVTIQLENISLKSALNLLLHQMHLTHLIQNEVLVITTSKHSHGGLTRKTYEVADLVIPVPNFGTVGQFQPECPLVPMENSVPMPNTPSPVMSPYSMMGGTPVGNPSGSSQGAPGAAAGFGSGGASISKSMPTKTNEETLIKLITTSIAPESWADMGGPGTIEYFPQTYGLVVNQTPDIQDQVQDLLLALRRLQDQEVAVEVKFIAVAEDFFERIGVNFNLNLFPGGVNGKGTTTFQPQLLSGQFAPAGYINQFTPKDFLSGLTAANTLTSTLSIPITQDSFYGTVPLYGGYVPAGLTMGLAFLSDIQVFLFMEAVQGDQRSNVMQAPKITLFNGQTASLNVSDQQPYVTGVRVVPQMGLFSFVPATSVFPAGVFLTLQAVISADRRFVRLSLAPTLTNLSTPIVQLFPIVTPIFPLFDGAATGQPVMFTQYIQQPRVVTVGVQTTVAVPDGGTVLMGGLKRLAEQRSEYGPPILSKIPYINRLFKNVGYGRSTESLLIMVTPRIIIQTEEQEVQTGYREPSPLAP